MTNQNDVRANPYIEIIQTLFFGALIGFVSIFFIKALNSLNEAQAYLNLKMPFHLFLIPVVYILIFFIKRNTLYFPLRINQLVAEKSSQYWSATMAPLHFFGTLVCHASGLSLGREGAAVLYSAGFVRIFKLSWIFWGPILSSIGFASIVGQYWVAPVFMMELFKTNWVQKTYALMGAVVAVLIGQYFQVQHLFQSFEFEDGLGFFTKLVGLFVFSLCAGLLMQLYKKAHSTLANYFSQTGFFVGLLVSVTLAVFLYLPEFRPFQSLGILQFSDLTQIQASFIKSFTKLSFTAVSTALGFLGGEFIPLVYSGTNFGASFFSLLGHSSELGGAFGAFALFAGATRLKWTSVVLMLSLLGFSWWFWAYFVVSFTIRFSGPNSLYLKNL